MSRKFYRHIILIIIFQGFLFSLGYNISGIVLDSKTKEPIKNINIYSLDENIAVTTDENGYFNLSSRDLDFLWDDNLTVVTNLRIPV